jgi:type VI secretion system protein ImpA
MPLRVDLLQPIPGSSPSGVDLRDDPIYDKIKDARTEDDDSPQGDWQRPRKAADFALVAKLAGDALASRSKDLKLAAFLTEAQLRREGFAGLRDGLELLRALLEQFWADAYPQLEEGDAEMRAVPLAWVALTLTPLVRTVPLTADGHDLYRYRQSREVGSEADAAGDTKRLQAREQAIAEGKVPAEEFDRSADATPKPWYKALVAGIDGSIRALQALDQLSRERFGEAAPTYGRLLEALEEVQHVAHQLLARKLELDPDPPEAVEVSGTALSAGDPLPGASAGGTVAVEAASSQDAAARAVAAARYLRRAEPCNPASYLILRGLRWGELRARRTGADPRMLEAPPPQARSQLRSLLLESKWKELLEAAEVLMGTPAGRGWLDLQRYALSACDAMGEAYEPVSRAIRGELTALLADLPELAEMTMMDDMPTASRETQQWLREAGVQKGADAPVGGNGAEPVPLRERAVSRPIDVTLERAMAEVQAGRPERGIEVLVAEVAKERSTRARFVRRTQIARIMVNTGMERIAMPILLDLLAQVEKHGLVEWEAGEQVAEPMALLYRCLLKHPDEPAGEHTPATLHPRICSLDPLQAISLARP